MNNKTFIDEFDELEEEEFDDVETWEEFYPYFDVYKDISDYTRFHNAIDRFMWLLRLRYSDRDTIKNKKYRLDILFQQFIKENTINPQNIYNKLIGERNSKEKFLYFLKQGWYNELAMAYPFIDDPMNLRTSLRHCEASWKVDLFPSWFIVKSYYSIYFYHNAFVFTNSDIIDTFEHRKPTKHFNCSLFKKFSSCLLYYPFNLCDPIINDIELLRNARKKEWDYLYSKYPRDSKLTIYDLEQIFINDLKSIKEELKTQSPVSIIDLLYLFRVWANYIGNDTVVNLRSGGLLLFLERNLYSLTFFFAGLCEILAIGFLGEKEYIKSFKRFYKDFIFQKDSLYDNWYFIPQIQRLRIFRHLGLISNYPEVIQPPNMDPLKLMKI